MESGMKSFLMRIVDLYVKVDGINHEFRNQVILKEYFCNEIRLLFLRSTDESFFIYELCSMHFKLFLYVETQSI